MRPFGAPSLFAHFAVREDKERRGRVNGSYQQDTVGARGLSELIPKNEWRIGGLCKKPRR